LGCALSRGALGASPRRRRHADRALERTRERGLGVVADVERDRRDVGMGTAQQIRCELHAPVRQVLHRRLADELHEPLVQRRARQPDLPAVFVEPSRLGGLLEQPSFALKALILAVQPRGCARSSSPATCPATT
jgi:hypothetical protein